MNQDFRNAQLTSGAGGAGTNGGSGGRGGDIGSHLYHDSKVENSNNDNRHQRHIKGVNYEGTVDQGDTYHGPIDNSIVGGRNNRNTMTNHGKAGGYFRKAMLSAEERKKAADKRLAELREKKERKEQLKKVEDEARQMEEEVRQLEAELGLDSSEEEQ